MRTADHVSAIGALDERARTRGTRARRPGAGPRGRALVERRRSRGRPGANLRAFVTSREGGVPIWGRNIMTVSTVRANDARAHDRARGERAQRDVAATILPQRRTPISEADALGTRTKQVRGHVGAELERPARDRACPGSTSSRAASPARCGSSTTSPRRTGATRRDRRPGGRPQRRRDGRDLR